MSYWTTTVPADGVLDDNATAGVRTSSSCSSTSSSSEKTSLEPSGEGSLLPLLGLTVLVMRRIAPSSLLASERVFRDAWAATYAFDQSHRLPVVLAMPVLLECFNQTGCCQLELCGADEGEAGDSNGLCIWSRPLAARIAFIVRHAAVKQ